MELKLEELEADAAEDALAAEQAAASAGDTTVRPHIRRKPARKPFPAHLPRERVIVPGPTACACCGSTRLAKLGEDVTETLKVVPRLVTNYDGQAPVVLRPSSSTPMRIPGMWAHRAVQRDHPDAWALDASAF